jgi:dTDP-4-dehydrorhamnose 3,5-epimerase
MKPIKDKAKASPEGEWLGPRIEDLHIRRLPPLEDGRGEIVELFRDAWQFHPDPLVYAYMIACRPESLRGWVTHKLQDDRIAIVSGTLMWAFFDNRKTSPTYRLLNVFTFSERNRVLFVIPKGVFHAVKNIGKSEAIFVNFPTRPYDHADPDKYRLPIQNDLIPFDFSGITTG